MQEFVIALGILFLSDGSVEVAMQPVASWEECVQIVENLETVALLSGYSKEAVRTACIRSEYVTRSGV